MNTTAPPSFEQPASLEEVGGLGPGPVTCDTLLQGSAGLPRDFCAMRRGETLTPEQGRRFRCIIP